MVTLVITNLTTAQLYLADIGITLSANGTVGGKDAVTITRTVAQLDSMPDLQRALNADSVSIAATESTDNNDLFSIPMTQHGSVTGLSVNSAAVVTSAVTFADPFPSGVVPKVFLTVGESLATAFKAARYVRSVTNTGFTIALDVTTAESGAVTTENGTYSPAENGVLLGPFTTTLANIPLTSAAITLHWLESTVAKVATITGTSTVGSTNAANISAASINRTTGALSITFASGHPPDTNSITVDYAQSKAASVDWTAVY